EFLAALERVMDDVKPQRVVLVTGASIAERLVRALAEDRAIPVDAAARIPSAAALAALLRALRGREEWQALRQLLRHPRRPAPVPEGHPRIVFTACQTRPFAANAVRRSIVTARLYLEAAARALDALRPDAVVIASDRRYAERALALTARARGIPVVLFWGASLLSRDRTNTFDVADRLLL